MCVCVCVCVCVKFYRKVVQGCHIIKESCSGLSQYLEKLFRAVIFQMLQKSFAGLPELSKMVYRTIFS